VALGAFGAHGLESTLVANGTLETWKTAAHYHLIHSLAMLAPWALGISRWRPWFWFFCGNILFSGSLYLLAAFNIKALGAVTPLGGLCYLIGWLALAVGSGRRSG